MINKLFSLISDNLYYIAILIYLFFWTSNTQIKFNPFSIKLNNPYFGFGFILLSIGLVILINTSYKNGYNHGVEDLIKYAQNVSDSILHKKDIKIQKKYI
jgi:hypothetical protein